MDLISAKFDFLEKNCSQIPWRDFLKSSYTDVNNVDLPLDLIPTPFYLFLSSLRFFIFNFSTSVERVTIIGQDQYC